jgi:hypothetical protein
MRAAAGLMALWVGMAVAPVPALAYSCTLEPAKDIVIVKADNATAHPITCKVDCVFATPEGPDTVSCSQQIPAGAKGWYVCVRPTGGKAMELSGGNETCQ